MSCLNRRPFLLALAFVTFVSSRSVAQSEYPAETNAACVLALGRPAIPADEPLPNQHSLTECFAGWRERVRRDDALRRTVNVKAWTDTFGRRPSAAEASDVTDAASYVEAMTGARQRLVASEIEYEQVIRRAYPLVIHREVYPEEITYWKKQGVIPFVLLVAGIEDWARRNQPGLMVTAGTPTVSVNSEFLVAARLSPALAAEARQIAGLPVLPTEPSSEESRRHLIAVGGQVFATGGGIHFVAAGRPDLVR